MNPAHNKKRIKSQVGAPTGAGELFLVATPIGNLGDLSRRAVEVLQAVDLIACEDTRTSAVLLRHYAIATKTTAYHAHNEAEATQRLLGLLQEGKRIALISDAGTPLLSDPGARLLGAAIEAGIRVTPIPGASALLAALTVSGLSAQPFYFAGFLPAKTGERGKLLAGLVRLKATLVFYEAPHRLAATLSELSEIFGPRAAGVARELTKLHETCERASLPELAAFFEEHPAKGECVILIAGASEEEAMDDAAIDAALREALTQHRLREAVDHVTALSQLPRSDIYARALALKEKK